MNVKNYSLYKLENKKRYVGFSVFAVNLLYFISCI